MGKTVLQLDGVTKSFGGLRAIENVSISVSQGEILGLIGPNGAGKTTLFSLISGFQRPDKGRIVFDGTDIVGMQPNQICRLGLARTFQIPQPFLGLSVLDNVAVGALHRFPKLQAARRRAREVLELLNMSDRAGTMASSLNVADRKKVEMGRAMAGEPRLILLDEVMGGLNQSEIQDIMGVIRTIRSTGVTVLAIEHVMKAVMEMSNRVAVLNREMIAIGLPREVSMNPAVVKAYLGREYCLAES